MTKIGTVAFLTGLAMAPLARAAEAPPYFAQCDGYGAPSNSGDGMIKQAMGLGGIMVAQPGYGIRRRLAPTPDAAGVTACDQAIAATPAAFWQRRVNLIRARAIHRLATGDISAAQRDIAAAREAVSDRSDPRYMQSLQLGDALIQAYALRLQGDHLAAGDLALAAFRSKPFDIGVARAALVAMGPQAPSATREIVVRRLAQLSPEDLDDVFVWAFEEGRFDEVITLYLQLQPRLEGDLKEWSVDFRLEYEAFRRPREVAGYLRRDLLYAYALAARGDKEKARSIIAQTDRQLASAIAEAPPIGRRTDRDTALIMAARAKGNRTLSAFADEIADWQSRLDNAGAGVITPLSQPWTGPNWSAGDYSEPRRLLNSLPEADTLERTPQYGRKINAWSDADTYKVISGKDGLKTVRYYLVDATAATTGEMALLKISELAREAGFARAQIIDRREMHLISFSNVLGTVAANNQDMGTVVEIDARFARPDDIGPGDQWRLLDTDAAYAALAPRYITPVGAKNR